jgi:hypothetical protein
MKKTILVCRHACLSSAVARPKQPPVLPAATLNLPLAKRPGFDLFGVTVACLRELCPTPFPVIIRTADLAPEMDGCCHRTQGRFVIQLDRGLDCEKAVNVVLHEWAHARAWNHLLDAACGTGMTPEEFDRLSHGPEFGIAFAEVWRTFSGVILPGIETCRALELDGAA